MKLPPKRREPFRTDLLTLEFALQHSIHPRLVSRSGVFDRERKVAFVVTTVGYSPSFDASLDGSTAQALRAFASRLTAMQGGG